MKGTAESNDLSRHFYGHLTRRVANFIRRWPAGGPFGVELVPMLNVGIPGTPPAAGAPNVGAPPNAVEPTGNGRRGGGGGGLLLLTWRRRRACTKGKRLVSDAVRKACSSGVRKTSERTAASSSGGGVRTTPKCVSSTEGG
uniref:Uncharacterized protein n=1 Tax=Anopheles atroparvus TaxID=41427 RepID=A0A182JH20_ANOAO